MLTKNGAGQGQGGMESELGGPDQERERTYRLAEKLGERLEDMGRDLGTMIEEVNVANAGLSKTTNADEPVCSALSLTPSPSLSLSLSLILGVVWCGVLCCVVL